MAKIKNDEEFFAVIDSVAQSAARIDTLKARLNEAKIALNLEWGTRIEEVEKPHRAEFNRAKKYALDHRDRLLGGEKSAQTKAGLGASRITASQSFRFLRRRTKKWLKNF